ncbi:MAG: hypothetical protein KAI79_08705 [Bacteroidales bacterium]|nr:hypothetical protein [Bacteroidales bacterium]
MKNRRLEWIVIGVLATALIASFGFYFYSMSKNKELLPEQAGNEDVERLMTDYSELEASYNKAIEEIESQVEGGDIGIDILKQNLTQILSDIKTEKDQISTQRYSKNADSLQYHTEQAQQMKDMLKMSKEVLVERLAEMQQQNSNLQTSNDRLLTRNEKLVGKIEKVNTWVEKEKVKNQGLNAQVIRVESRMKKLEEQGDSSNEMFTKLKAEKQYFREKLEESNTLIEVQSEKIAELGVIVKKVSVECYFIYQEGNTEEEAKIYLTNNGIAKRYTKYFETEKPRIHFDFLINDYMFDEGNERVDFKLFNENDIDLYSTSKSASVGVLSFIVPHQNFRLGMGYFITLFAGLDNLLIDEKYQFRVSK